jgi:transcriptional regulator with XRE-family HTH domain
MRQDDFGAWLREIHARAVREGRISSQAEAARRMGHVTPRGDVARDKVSRWMRGERLPDYEELMDLYVCYGFDLLEAFKVIVENQRAWGGLRIRKGPQAAAGAPSAPPADDGRPDASAEMLFPFLDEPSEPLAELPPDTAPPEAGSEPPARRRTPRSGRPRRA